MLESQDVIAMYSRVLCERGVGGVSHRGSFISSEST